MRRCACCALSSLALGAFLLWLAIPAVLAQETRGQILGRVLDQSGAVVVGATVRAMNTGTNVETTSTTNESGDYMLPLLISGTYDVTVEMTGFKKSVEKDVVVRVADKITINISLQLGEASESVQVVGAAPLVEAASAYDVLQNTALNARRLLCRRFCRLWRHLQEFRRLERAAGHARQQNRALEIIAPFDASADGTVTGPLRRQVQLGRSLQHAIHVVPQLVAVIHQRGVIPGAERVELLTVDQRLRVVSGQRKAVQEPILTGHPNLEEEPRLRVLSGLWVAFAQVEESLLGLPAQAGTEDHFPGERFRAGEGVNVHVERVIDAIELHRLAQRRLHHSRVAQDLGWIAADLVNPIKPPDLSGGSLRRQEKDPGQRAAGRDPQYA